MCDGSRRSETYQWGGTHCCLSRIVELDGRMEYCDNIHMCGEVLHFSTCVKHITSVCDKVLFQLTFLLRC